MAWLSWYLTNHFLILHTLKIRAQLTHLPLPPISLLNISFSHCIPIVFCISLALCSMQKRKARKHFMILISSIFANAHGKNTGIKFKNRKQLNFLFICLFPGLRSVFSIWRKGQKSFLYLKCLERSLAHIQQESHFYFANAQRSIWRIITRKKKCDN